MRFHGERPFTLCGTNSMRLISKPASSLIVGHVGQFQPSGEEGNQVKWSEIGHQVAPARQE